MLINRLHPDTRGPEAAAKRAADAKEREANPSARPAQPLPPPHAIGDAPELAAHVAAIASAEIEEAGAASALEAASAELAIAERAFLETDQSEKAYAPVEKARRTRDRLALIHDARAKAHAVARAEHDAAERALRTGRLDAARSLANSLRDRLRPRIDRLLAIHDEMLSIKNEIAADVAAVNVGAAEAHRLCHGTHEAPGCKFSDDQSALQIIGQVIEDLAGPARTFEAHPRVWAAQSLGVAVPWRRPDPAPAVPPVPVDVTADTTDPS